MFYSAVYSLGGALYRPLINNKTESDRSPGVLICNQRKRLPSEKSSVTSSKNGPPANREDALDHVTQDFSLVSE